MKNLFYACLLMLSLYLGITIARGSSHHYSLNVEIWHESDPGKTLVNDEWILKPKRWIKGHSISSDGYTFSMDTAERTFVFNSRDFGECANFIPKGKDPFCRTNSGYVFSSTLYAYHGPIAF